MPEKKKKTVRSYYLFGEAIWTYPPNPEIHTLTVEVGKKLTGTAAVMSDHTF